MKNWLVLRDLRDLQEFLGLTRYYRRFVKGYQKIKELLANLIFKKCFWMKWNAMKAMEAFKLAMITIPILAMLDLVRYLWLGVVLMQKDRPISFISEVLSLCNRGKFIYKKELMTIVMALQKWQHYLFDRHFKIKTN